MKVPGFIGGSNRLLNANQDCEQTVGWYVEPTAPGVSKAGGGLVRTPGISPKFEMPDQPVRGLEFQDGRGFCVGGGKFAEFFENWALDHIFDIANDGGQVSMVTGGNSGNTQTLVTSAGVGYVFDWTANTFTQITDPNFPSPARQCAFWGGYFFVLWGGGSRKFSWSLLENAMHWPALNVAERSFASDNLSTLIRLSGQLLLMGNETSEWWGLTSDPDNPVAPVQSAVMQQGSQAAFAAQRCGEAIVFLSLGEDGNCAVYRVTGYDPVKVSTPAVDLALSRSETPTDAIAWVYAYRGHLIYVLILPRDQEFAWAYDVTTNVWFNMAHWLPNTAESVPYVGGCHAFAFNTHVVGDRFSGAVYELSQNILDEEIVSPT